MSIKDLLLGEPTEQVKVTISQEGKSVPYAENCIRPTHYAYPNTNIWKEKDNDSLISKEELNLKNEEKKAKDEERNPPSAGALFIPAASELAKISAYHLNGIPAINWFNGIKDGEALTKEIVTHMWMAAENGSNKLDIHIAAEDELVKYCSKQDDLTHVSQKLRNYLDPVVKDFLDKGYGCTVYLYANCVDQKNENEYAVDILNPDAEIEGKISELEIVFNLQW